MSSLELKKLFEIKITVQRVEELIPQLDKTRYRKRFLDPDIEHYIVEKATKSNAHHKIVLNIEFLSEEPVDREQVTIALKKNQWRKLSDNHRKPFAG